LSASKYATTVDDKKETRAFFTRFFHYDLTDSDFDSIMNAKAP
jgi:hypothetical protein